MTVARATFAQTSFGRAVLRRTSTQTRTQVWRRAARRGYASTGHASPERAQKSSDLPWMIGSVALTVPAAVWLFNQGPKRGTPHGPEEAEHERDEHDKDAEEPAEESEVAVRGETAPAKGKKVKEGSGESEEENSDMTTKDESGPDPSTKEGGDEDKAAQDNEEQKEDGEDKSTEEEKKDKPKPEGDDQKADKKEDKAEAKEGKSDSEEAKADDSSSESDGDKDTPPTSDDESSGERKKDKDGYELPGPNAPGQINYKSSSKKGPGEEQKGPRREPELAGERQSHKDSSGAKNPYLDDDEKSKKGEGVKETMKIHGTVDPNRPAR